MAVVTGEATDIIDVVQAMRSARRITAVCHENPDADTIGAAISVVIIAERLGVEAELVSADGIPPMFDFLPRVATVKRKPHFEPDLAVICDAASLERVGRIAELEREWFARARIVNIDHHVSSNYFGDLNLVDPRAAATCELLARVAEAADVLVDVELATALLAGIVRDSHGFSDAATSADTLRIAARLMDAGAPLATIHRSLLSELPVATLALWGRLLAALGQAASGRIVFTTLTQQMLRDTNTQQHDADGLAEFLARAKGADVTILIREIEDDQVRVSIRTTEVANASLIASQFGGGGHARRAGCSVAGELNAVLGRILAVATDALAS